MAVRERADAARNRVAILTAASTLFAAVDDPMTVTMDDVAAAAGVGKGTLFRRFGDRAGLLRAVFETRITALTDTLNAGPPPLGPATPAREPSAPARNRLTPKLRRVFPPPWRPLADATIRIRYQSRNEIEISLTSPLLLQAAIARTQAGSSHQRNVFIRFLPMVTDVPRVCASSQCRCCITSDSLVVDLITRREAPRSLRRSA